jgi:hypothetical protein
MATTRAFAIGLLYAVGILSSTTVWALNLSLRGARDGHPRAGAGMPAGLGQGSRLVTAQDGVPPGGVA